MKEAPGRTCRRASQGPGAGGLGWPVCENQGADGFGGAQCWSVWLCFPLSFSPWTLIHLSMSICLSLHSPPCACSVSLVHTWDVLTSLRAGLPLRVSIPLSPRGSPSHGPRPETVSDSAWVTGPFRFDPVKWEWWVGEGEQGFVMQMGCSELSSVKGGV